MPRLSIVIGALALTMSACGSDDAASPSTTPEATATTAVPTSVPSTNPSAPTTTTSPSTTAPAPSTTVAAGTTIDVTVAGGDVSGADDRVEVSTGDDVIVRVTSDVADEVHVHGYDLFADLTPGTPGEITFTADIPGVFEVELEDAGRLLFELQVS